MKTQIGFSDETVAEIADALHILLADTYILYIKTLNCHWNVEDPRFFSLHGLFEEQYTQLAKNGDAIAERIRILGRKVSASLRDFVDMGTVEEVQIDLSGDEMLSKLAQSHEHMVVQMREGIATSEEHGDPGTADLLTGILEFHEKTTWFLRSHL